MMLLWDFTPLQLMVLKDNGFIKKEGFPTYQSKSNIAINITVPAYVLETLLF